MNSYYLTTILFLPAVGAIVIALISRKDDVLLKRVAAVFAGKGQDSSPDHGGHET